MAGSFQDTMDVVFSQLSQENPSEELERAILLDDAQAVDMILSHGSGSLEISWEEVFSRGLQNRPSILRLALEKGVNPNAPCRGMHPLHLCCRSKSCSNARKSRRLLGV
jgi:hypothetical protein